MALLLGCGSAPQPVAVDCPPPWVTLDEDASKERLDREFGRVTFTQLGTCSTGFMGWTVVSVLRLEGPPPTFEGEPIPAQQARQTLESVRVQLPSLIGTHPWTSIASSRVTDQGGNTDTRLLYSGDAEQVLFFFEHAG